MTEIESFVDRLEGIAPLTIQDFIEKYGLASKCRDRHLVSIRQHLMLMLHNKTTMTSSQIGSLFNRDHATVLWSIKRATWYAKTKDHVHKEIISEYRDELERLDFSSLKRMGVKIRS